MKVLRARTFEKAVRKLGASEAELAALEDAIAADPNVGDVIPGLHGARKVRFAMAGRGKRGGGRAVYVAVWVADAAYLVFAYSKADQEDLSAAQRRMIGEMLKELPDGRR